VGAGGDGAEHVVVVPAEVRALYVIFGDEPMREDEPLDDVS